MGGWVGGALEPQLKLRTPPSKTTDAIMASLCFRVAATVASLATVAGLYGPVHRWLKARECGYASLSRARRLYCVKNRIKSALLGCATPLALLIIWDQMVHGSFRRPELMAAAGALYAANDVVALCMVPELPLTTVCHHTCVALFALANLVHDYGDRSSAFSHAPMLAAFSCLSFPVNYYLSLRHLRCPAARRGVGRVAFAVYLPTFVANVAYHAGAMRTGGGRLYYLLLLLIFRDDVVLLRYLWRSSYAPSGEGDAGGEADRRPRHA